VFSGFSNSCLKFRFFFVFSACFGCSLKVVFEKKQFFFLFFSFELWRLAICREFDLGFCVCVCASESLWFGSFVMLLMLNSIAKCYVWNSVFNFCVGAFRKNPTIFLCFVNVIFLNYCAWKSWIWLSFRSVLAVLRKWVS
jgi:hypothetical protein